MWEDASRDPVDDGTGHAMLWLWNQAELWGLSILWNDLPPGGTSPPLKGHFIAIDNMGNRYGEAIQKDGFFSIYADEDSYQAQNLRFSNPEDAPWHIYCWIFSWEFK